MTSKELRRILDVYEKRVYLPLMDDFIVEDPIGDDLRNVRTALIGQIELLHEAEEASLLTLAEKRSRSP